jgi:predicted GIY-YIG superfamily endonuclease
MTVYLLHFDEPISDRHTCQHYLGSGDDVNARLGDHLAGRGARLTRVALERGISWRVARLWQGGRRKERLLKRQKNGPRLCPICNPPD